MSCCVYYVHSQYQSASLLKFCATSPSRECFSLCVVQWYKLYNILYNYWTCTGISKNPSSSNYSFPLNGYFFGGRSDANTCRVVGHRRGYQPLETYVGPSPRQRAQNLFWNRVFTKRKKQTNKQTVSVATAKCNIYEGQFRSIPRESLWLTPSIDNLVNRPSSVGTFPVLKNTGEQSWSAFDRNQNVAW